MHQRNQRSHKLYIDCCDFSCDDKIFGAVGQDKFTVFHIFHILIQKENNFFYFQVYDVENDFRAIGEMEGKYAVVFHPTQPEIAAVSIGAWNSPNSILVSFNFFVFV